MHFRGQKKNNCDVYINDPIETDKDGNPLTLSEIVADDMDIEERIDQKIKVENMQAMLCSALTKREQVIICMRYGLNGNIPHTQREIAGQLHISRSYVSRIEKKALEKLKACLEQN